MSFKDKRKKLKQEFANFLEIPRDVMLDLPKVVLIGDMQVFIENHRGIVEYNSQRLRVKVSTGEVEVAGENLVLRNIMPDEIGVEGRIKGVTMLS